MDTKSMVFIVALLLVGGCQGDDGMRRFVFGDAHVNREVMPKLRVGMNQDQVREVMGPPSTIEASGETEWWLYLTKDARTTYPHSPSEYTPVAFENGVLAGWGRNFYGGAKKYEFDVNINQP